MIDTWKRDNHITKTALPFILDMKKDFNTIKDKIKSNNQHLRTIIKSYLIEHNKYESELQVDKKTIAYYAQEIECRVLDQVYLYCVDK